MGEEEDGMIWKNGVETYNMIYETNHQPSSMHGTGCLGLVHWDPEGWYGKEGGRRIQDEEHVYACGGFMLR